LDDFISSIREQIRLEVEEWWCSLNRPETDAVWFGPLMQAAEEKKRQAKQALLLHQRMHSCSSVDPGGPLTRELTPS
jgi:hypothetical protein